MASRPRLLDLFCGAGGCAVGYHRAGFDVVGVDIKPQKNYPFEFVRADALEYLSANGHRFDAIHASPPCQRYSVARHIHGNGDDHADFFVATRDVLEMAGRPWVIENVRGAPFEFCSVLCGLMFGLGVLRHRGFECSFLLMTPPHPVHPKGNLTNSYAGYSTGREGFVCVAGNNFSRSAGATAMGIDWPMTRKELAQAIPPAYTEFVGRQLIQRVGD